ncbi:hypothetical protein BH23BAC2_BH23BAC2_05720 [soil metagenome]
MTRTFFCFFLFSIFAVNAQIKDTLEYVREKAYTQDFGEANRILTLYNYRGNEVYGLWLQGQVAYWMGDTRKALKLYNKAYLLNPILTDLQLDYGRILFNSGELKESREILSQYQISDPTHPETLIMLAYLDFWNGETGKAKTQAEEVLLNNPGNEMAIKLLNDIRVTTAVFVNLAASFATDDQPLDVNSYTITAGKYHSRWLSPVIKAGYRNFTLPETNTQSSFVEVGNRLRFGTSGPEINLMGGVFQAEYGEQSTNYIGSLGISQKLAKHLSLELKVARTPYQYTLSSLENPLMQTVTSLGLSLDDRNSILGKLAYERQLFPDENIIHTTYAYFLKSLFSSEIFRFDLGYSFNYVHSEKNAFRPVEGVTVRPGTINDQVSGIYDPYFSPQNQMVNSALVSVKLKPAESWEIKLRSNYGFYAKTEVPVIQDNRNIGGPLNTSTQFYETTYTPYEVFGEVRANLSKGLSIGGQYQYSKLFFYEFHVAGVSLNYSFL